MSSNPLYISVSRRTDIPRFFVNEFFIAWLAGGITYDGGYGKTHTVSLLPRDVLGYIFWSKDYSPLINHPLFEKCIGKNNAVFHFTINDCPDLEPRVAPLEGRIATLRKLCELVGPERVFWRFDPLCKYRGPGGILADNKDAFFKILPLAARQGIRRCYFSFMSFYNKLNTRGMEFEQFTLQEKADIGRRMLEACSEKGMTLYSCCNPEVPALAPGIETAHCIDDDSLRETDRFGVHPALRLKPTREGCGCFESRDIGSYLQKCPHGCRYCYANPMH